MCGSKGKCFFVHTIDFYGKIFIQTEWTNEKRRFSKEKSDPDMVVNITDQFLKQAHSISLRVSIQKIYIISVIMNILNIRWGAPVHLINVTKMFMKRFASDSVKKHENDLSKNNANEKNNIFSYNEE